MTLRLRRLLLPFLALLVSACQDVPIAPTARTVAASASANGVGRPDTLSEYGCFLSSVNPARPGWWRYGQTGLRFPAAALAKDTAKLHYRFRRRAPDGTPLRVANCVIPRTRGAVVMMNRWLHVAQGARTRDDSREGDVLVLMETTCTDMSNGDGVCILDGLDAIAQPVDGEVDAGGSGAAPIPMTPLGPDGSGGSGNPNMGTPCLECTYGSASLTCTSGVTRGSTVSCRVNTGDLRGTSAAGWTFTPQESDGATYIIDGPASGLAWQGTAVLGGMVAVVVTDRAGTRPLTYEMTVRPRGWMWTNKGVSSYSDGTGTPCYTGTPASDQPNGWNQGLNLANPCAGDEKFIQPDSEGSADANGPMDGFTVSPAISSGPNKGLYYVTNATLYLRRKSAYNPSLAADAPGEALAGWNLNHCPAHPTTANWQQFSRCKGADVEGYLAGLRGHEGEGRNGGTGHYSAALRLVSDPANDPMLFFDAEVSEPGQSRDLFLRDLRREFMTRMGRVEAGARPNADGGGLATGNWSGTVYRWRRSTGTFESYNQTM